MTRTVCFVPCFSDKSDVLKLFAWQVCLRYKMSATLLSIRQPIVRLRHEDNVSIGTIANIKKSKSTITGIFNVYDDMGSCEARKST